MGNDRDPQFPMRLNLASEVLRRILAVGSGATEFVFDSENLCHEPL
jgi:hypothetical protein